MRRLRIPDLARNPISWAGATVATTAAVLFLVLFALEVLGYLANPYIGLLVFVAVPTAFVLSLLLIPIGIWRARRRRQARPGEAEWPVLDLGNPRHRRVTTIVFALTLVNALIVSLAAYGGVHYMESTEFCGDVCHTPMEPQYAAYQNAPHSRVPCVACHVGSGAENFVRAKADGTRQLWHVATGGYARPIPSPVHNMRPARETCEQCHWSEKVHGDRPRTIREYADDETNSETVTTFLVHVGGGSEKLGIATGIHWHMNIANEIEYIAPDAVRQTIPFVRLKARDGRITEYTVAGTTDDPLKRGEVRQMDCIDCHNQPAHRFEATPQRAVDTAIAAGLLPRALPFVRREAVAAVSAEYPDTPAAMTGIATKVQEFYKGNAAVDRKLVEQAIRAAQAVYVRNVFPRMAVKWGTYPSNLGHVDSPGCFRCHDDEHRSKEGRVIRQDCELCHTAPEVK